MRDFEKVDLINKWAEFFEMNAKTWTPELAVQVKDLYAAISSGSSISIDQSSDIVMLLNKHGIDPSDRIWLFLWVSSA